MAKFTIDGIHLEIPDDCLSDKIEHSINTGKYEGSEARAMKRHLVPDDRMVDLGAGAGYLCSLAARIVGGDSVLGVEANPDMARAAQANLRRNANGKGNVLHAAVMPDGFTEDVVRFLAPTSFWSGHVDTTSTRTRRRHVEVPAITISEIIDEFAPTLVTMDVEGTEAELADYRWPDHVRTVILEIHPDSYAPEKLNAIFTGFFDSGLTYCPWGSRSSTLIFERPLQLVV